MNGSDWSEVLPPCSPQRSWRYVPEANPDARTIVFPAIYNGVTVRMTAVAHGDQIDLYPIASHRIEIPLEEWHQVAMFLTVAAHSR